MQARRPKLLDLIAVLERPPDIDVEIGDVGTVVELLSPDGLEVEFLDRDGRTRCLATLSYVLQKGCPLHPPRRKAGIAERCLCVTIKHRYQSKDTE
jgi:hypothetical protein